MYNRINNMQIYTRVKLKMYNILYTRCVYDYDTVIYDYVVISSKRDTADREG